MFSQNYYQTIATTNHHRTTNNRVFCNMTLCKYIVFILQGSKDCIWEEVNKDLWRKELSIYEPLGVYTKCLKSGEGVGCGL